jgi:hypothetical protein
MDSNEHKYAGHVSEAPVVVCCVAYRWKLTEKAANTNFRLKCSQA